MCRDEIIDLTFGCVFLIRIHNLCLNSKGIQIAPGDANGPACTS